MPLLPITLDDHWGNLIPGTGLRGDKRAMKLVAPDVVYVNIVDMQWGRPMWLFEKVIEVLSGCGPEILSSRRTKK